VLELTTDFACRVSVSVSDGTSTWERNFLDFGTIHSNIVLGFKPDRTNSIIVSVQDKNRNRVTLPNPVTFVTGPLPYYFPKIVLLTNNPDRMEPGYTLFRGQNNSAPAFVIIVDNAGQLVWYSSVQSTLDVRQLANGNLFIPLAETINEVNMLGETVQTWTVPDGWLVDHHDAVPSQHESILYLSGASRVVTNFPTSATDPKAPTATTNVLYQAVIEMSATNSELLNVWHTIDMLDPRRISYLTFSIRTAMGWDWGHANAVIEDPRDDSLIVSLRHQNAVIKFARGTGELKWILGPHENWGPAFEPYLLTPVGTPFGWNYAQHAPKITPQGTLLLYDNGDFRASPFDTVVADATNYSRAVEYEINEEAMEVSQVWEYASTNEPFYTPSVGDADFLKQSGNVLVTFGNIKYVSGARPSPYSGRASMARIQEVTHDPAPEVVFDLALFDYENTDSNYPGCFTYRSDRIPDLYSVLPLPVTDLTLTSRESAWLLDFSGNETRTYLVEASTNLLDWQTLGMARHLENGNFHFVDPQTDDLPARYYRVETK
jgi:arylsulfate sulfotransferase